MQTSKKKLQIPKMPFCTHKTIVDTTQAITHRYTPRDITVSKALWSTHILNQFAKAKGRSLPVIGSKDIIND